MRKTFMWIRDKRVSFHGVKGEEYRGEGLKDSELSGGLCGIRKWLGKGERREQVIRLLKGSIAFAILLSSL